MKIAIYLLTILGYSLALPSSSFARKNIKGKNVYIEPISSYTADVPIGERVIGGSEVARNSVPYQVAIFIDGNNFCGGSLISKRFVLTAAHCTIGAFSVDLLFGAHDLQVIEPTEVMVSSTHILNHPDYQPGIFHNDVALILIPVDIDLNSNIQIIPLAPADAGTYEGSSAYLTGWGRTSNASTAISSTLQGVNLNIISNARCAVTYGNAIVNSILCTSGAGIVGACKGDSGGPLVVDGVQVGIVSFVAKSGCENGLPSGFTRVSSFRSWIAENTDVLL